MYAHKITQLFRKRHSRCILFGKIIAFSKLSTSPKIRRKTDRVGHLAFGIEHLHGGHRCCWLVVRTQNAVRKRLESSV